MKGKEATLGRVVTGSIEINATREDVFRYLTEAKLIMRWAPGLIRYETIEGPDGTRLGRSTYRLSNRRWVVLGRIVKKEPPNYLVTRADGHKGAEVSETRLTTAGDKTRVEQKVRPILKGHRRLIAPLLQDVGKAQLDLGLERLKQAVERPESPPPRLTRVKIPWSPRLLAFRVVFWTAVYGTFFGVLFAIAAWYD